MIDRSDLPAVSNVKASLVLIDAEKPDQNYGLVEDTLQKIGWKPGDGETVGSWHRYPSDGIIHVQLLESAKALQDRAIEILKQVLELEKNGKLRKQKSPSAPRKPKTAAPIPEAPSHPDILEGFKSLREKLASAKKPSTEEHHDIEVPGP